MILLDTHVLLWSQSEQRQLGKKTRTLIERFWGTGAACASAISFWEAGQILERKRIKLHVTLNEWRETLITSGLTELPLNGDIAIRSFDLGALHGDPADRFIAATAIKHHCILVTADEKLLAWRHTLERFDART
jgi:PIN domain nuclease of toxin-antitoxin system